MQPSIKRSYTMFIVGINLFCIMFEEGSIGSRYAYLNYCSGCIKETWREGQILLNII